ncbi:unnamed protein product [Urochloa decumbens]|uniref:Uncharacterized protein n=1 Tax=Urochloa decumbens TaxID=240449 RepID=A0ABC9GEB6_9POAL
MEYKARRRHVPAFGEWNYYSASSSPEEQPPPPPLPYSGGAVVSAECGSAAAPWWYAAAAEPEACSDAWFRYSPPPRSSSRPKKARRPAAAVPLPAEPEKKLPCYSVGGSVLPAAEVRAARAAAAPAKGGRRVVMPVDADLYRVPTPDDSAVVSRRPRRKRASRRSLWMGCLGGFNCVA